MQGICKDVGDTTTLVVGRRYFLFEHGPNNVYVSNFDRESAHFGSYNRNHFDLVEDEPFEHPGELLDDGRVVYFSENPDIEPIIEQPKRYIAEVNKRHLWMGIGQRFIISDPNAGGYYNVYYLDDNAYGAPIGSYITNYFKIIEEYKPKEKVMLPTLTETAQIEPEVKTQPNALPDIKTAEIKPKTKPKKAKKEKFIIPDGQMDIFDFMEG